MLDFEYAKALAEVVLDATCSEKEREIKNNPRNVMPAIDVSPNIRI